MTEIDTCPICAGTSFSKFLTCQDHSISREKFSIIRCTKCELLITSPRPTTDELHKYYESPAYTSHVGAAKTFFDRVYQAARGFTLRWKRSLIEQYAPKGQSKSLLDIGCGTGEFLKTAKHNGWHITGMEPSQPARLQAHHSVSGNIRSSLNEIVNDGQQFAIITLWHVLEHIPDLDKTMQTLKALLVRDGTIFIAVPNHSSFDGKHYKDSWAGYDVPRHLWHFNKKSMTFLLQKHNLKLHRIIPMRLDAFYVALLSEKYKNHGSLSITGAVKAALTALKSNSKASGTHEYSSLIYVVKK